MKTFLNIIFIGSLVSISFGANYEISADFSKIDSFPLQKSQFGVSYVAASDMHIENVYELLQVRNSRNNDKRLIRTWKGWDLSGNPLYERSAGLSKLLEEASHHGAVGGANLQGPYEHLAAQVYRISSQSENLWNWELYSEHSLLYHKHLEALIDAKHEFPHPFVFGIGHEANNDANLDTLGLGEGCVDGIAFMKDLPAFHNLVIKKGEKEQGDVIQATTFFEWYERTMGLLLEEYGDRNEFLVAAAQPHTQKHAMTTYFRTIRELIDTKPDEYVPDYIGSHSRWNIPGDDRFIETVLEPSRSLFHDDPNWMAVPVMCNEFGIRDHMPEYKGSMLAVVRMLNNFEQFLRSPDVGYINFIYGKYFESGNGSMFYPPFHVFRFYQNMPQSRTKISGRFPNDMHVLSSVSQDSRQAAILWRDESGEGTHDVNFTFANAPEFWTKAKASLYVMSNEDIEAPMPSQRSSGDYGFDEYLVDGYPKIIKGHNLLKQYTFENVSLPRASIAMLKLERMDPDQDESDVIMDHELHNVGPTGARFMKTWQWTARNGEGGVDPSWGYFDTRNWTLFAGIDDISDASGSVQASYLLNQRVKRGLVGAEFKNGSRALNLEVDLNVADPDWKHADPECICALRIDFYNEESMAYDTAIVLAGDHFPEVPAYTADYIPWGFGKGDSKILPSLIFRKQIWNGRILSLDLDQLYQEATGKSASEGFISGGRRIILSAWVENIEAGLVVRISDE